MGHQAMIRAHFEDLPEGQVRAWARDPATQAFQASLHRRRQNSVDSIVALSKAQPDGRHAREQALHHAGAEEVLSDLITMIAIAGNQPDLSEGIQRG